jgi:hypothetical protein
MFSNKGQQQQKQSGGYHYGTTPSKSTHSKSRSSTKRLMNNTQNPFQNQAELHKIMALFQ